MPRQKMGSLTHGGEELTCLFGEKWPPAEIAAYGSIAAAAPYLDEKEVQRLEVWEQVCGLTSMALKCLSCKYLVKDGSAQMYRGRHRVISKRLKAPSKKR